jgi:hypothetical protein
LRSADGELLFDQNLSPRLCDRLRDIWTDVVHVRAVGLAAADDAAVWAYARQHGFTIVSKDGDFSGRSSLFRLRYRLAGDHDLCRAVVGRTMRAILGFLRRRARDAGVQDGRSGAVAIVQRFGGGGQFRHSYPCLGG